MKHFLASLGGALVGIAMVGLALYYNPLMRERPSVPSAGDDEWVLTYNLPAENVIAFTHGRETRLPLKPSSIAPLWESTISGTALSVLALREPDQAPSVMASRISVPAERSEPILRGMILSDHWLVTVPGEGSLFMSAESNLWSFLKQAVVPVWVLGQQWQGPASYRPMVGPGAEATALVQGATGRFRTVTGRAVEQYLLEEFSRERGPEKLSVQLAVAFDEAPPAAMSPAGTAASRN